MRFGGANPERTTCVGLSRAETHEQETARKLVRDDTRRHQVRVCVDVRDEEVAGSNPVTRPL
jgi:hypothetical protein